MSLDELARLNGLKLVPGMPVEAFIRTTSARCCLISSSR
jgi:hypothetical protein